MVIPSLGQLLGISDHFFSQITVWEDIPLDHDRSMATGFLERGILDRNISEMVPLVSRELSVESP